jgi:hypothetical protein
MRVLLVVSLALGLVLASTRALAQDADALRRELEQLRQQLKTSPPWPASRWAGPSPRGCPWDGSSGPSSA